VGKEVNRCGSAPGAADNSYPSRKDYTNNEACSRSSDAALGYKKPYRRVVARSLQKRIDPETGLALIDFPMEQRLAERPAA
jgi:hypothetical protein